MHDFLPGWELSLWMNILGVDYASYMRSKEWKYRREQIIERAQGKCERCGSEGWKARDARGAIRFYENDGDVMTIMSEERRKALIAEHKQALYGGSQWMFDTLTIHHKTYEHLGNEPLEDLEALCKDCHRKADAERRKRFKLAGEEVMEKNREANKRHEARSEAYRRGEI